MLPGKKTYIAAVMTVLGFWAAHLSGEMELASTIQATVTAILAATLRAGVAKGPDISPKLIAPAALLLVVGCQTSPSGFPQNDPRHDYDWAQTQYNKTLQNLLIMKRADDISQEDWDNTIYPLILEGDKILDQVEAAALAANATVLDVRITAFRAIYAKLVVWALVGEQGALDVGDELNALVIISGGSSNAGDGIRGPGLGREGAEPRNPGSSQAASQATRCRGGTGIVRPGTIRLAA